MAENRSTVISRFLIAEPHLLGKLGVLQRDSSWDWLNESKNHVIHNTFLRVLRALAILISRLIVLQ